jgi:acetolactate synthase-1/2/3 large subunit
LTRKTDLIPAKGPSSNNSYTEVRENACRSERRVSTDSVIPVRALSISGDGGFLFNAQEMATAVRHGIAVVAVVFDDGAYGNVKRSQQLRYGNRMLAWDLANPDFVSLANSFGITARRVTAPAALTEAIVEALGADEPRLIHVPVGPMPDPWRFVHMGKVRG